MDSLPLEILIDIFSRLTISNLIRSARVSTYWRDAIYNMTEEKVWRNVNCYMKGYMLYINCMGYEYGIMIPDETREKNQFFNLKRMLAYLDNREWPFAPSKGISLYGHHTRFISIVLDKTFHISDNKTDKIMYEFSPKKIYLIYRLVHSLNQIMYCTSPQSGETIG
jgi:hypothetical protein